MIHYSLMHGPTGSAIHSQISISPCFRASVISRTARIPIGLPLKLLLFSIVLDGDEQNVLLVRGRGGRGDHNGFFLRHRRPGQEGAKYRDEGEYGISQ